VRCASCKHSWHQDPEPATADEADAAGEESIAEATLIEPRSGPEAEQRAYEEAIIEEEAAPQASAIEPAPLKSASRDETQERQAAEYAAEQRAQALSADFDGGEALEAMPAAAAADWREPPQAETADDEFSPFPSPDERAPKRRNPIVTVLIIVIAVAIIAAAFYFLAPPDLKARLGLGAGAAGQLALIVTHKERQQLESGNQLVTVTGRVINPTAKEQEVPPLQAQLTSKSGKLVYSWTIAPPTRSLAAGASTSFNSAEVNVPPGGEYLTIKVG
jgi:hypothetical protein